MKVVVIPVTPFEQNCSLLICETTSKGAIVDPGGDIELIIKKVKELKLDIELILITHGHLDHCGAASQLKEILNVEIQGPHIDDDFWIAQLPEQGTQFGMPNLRTFVPEKWLTHGDKVVFGEVELEVLHCPGHTPGHVVFFNRDARIAIVGDVLFHGSIGRTDFPKGDYSSLISSIRDKLWPLGSDVQFLPGHGPSSTFGRERESNPFVSDQNFK